MLMTKEVYYIDGMTCGGCVAKVEEALKDLPGVASVKAQLDAPQAVLETERPISLSEVNARLASKGNYKAFDEAQEKKLPPLPAIAKKKKNTPPAEHMPRPSLITYKPLLLIVTFIASVTLLSQYPFTPFSGALWMRHFMAGFFIVFSFFKLLNLKGFASSYAMYDIIAARWKGWGYIYPFVELGLGVAYLTNVAPVATNISTIVILGVSSIGVIESNLNKRKIKCACLGDVFNLPMSTITIIEDLSMVAMAAWMLVF